MTMDLPIFEVGLKEISSGLLPGVNKLSSPLWETALNVDFDAFGVHTSKGREVMEFEDILFDSGSGNFDSASGLFDDYALAIPFQLPTNKEVIGLLQIYRSTPTRFLIAGTRDKLYAYSGSVIHTSSGTFNGIKDSAGPVRATQWSMVNVGNWALATNGVDGPQILKTTTWAAMGSLPFTWAEIFRKFGPYVLAFNTSNDPKKVEWCADDDVENWTPGASNTAGNLLLRDLASPIRAAEPLGSLFAVYTENQLIKFGWKPNAFVFGTEGTVLDGPGAVSKSSIVPADGLHYGLMKQGVFKTDGLSVQWLDYPAFGDWLKNEVNWDQGAKIVGYHASAKKQIRWSVPLVGSLDNNYEISYNYVTGAVTFGDKAFTAASPQQIFQYPIIGGYNGSVTLGQKSNSDLTLAVTRTLQTKPMDLGLSTEWKYVDYVETQIEVRSGSGPTIEIGTQVEPDDTITWSTAETIGPGPLARNFIRVSGPYLSVRYTSAAANDDWKISGFRLFGTRDGGTI